jgi:hypothetical protein
MVRGTVSSLSGAFQSCVTQLKGEYNNYCLCISVHLSHLPPLGPGVQLAAPISPNELVCYFGAPRLS